MSTTEGRTDGCVADQTLSDVAADPGNEGTHNDRGKMAGSTSRAVVHAAETFDVRSPQDRFS